MSHSDSSYSARDSRAAPEAQKAAPAAKAAAPVVAAPATPAQSEEEEKPKPKPKNPLDELPPSKMILDSWKRLYSNTPASKFREIAINGLWNGADIPNSLSNEVCGTLLNAA